MVRFLDMPFGKSEGLFFARKMEVYDADVARSKIDIGGGKGMV